MAEMIAELRARSQITIPSSAIKQLGLEKGDKFEVIVKDGGIFLCPVVILTKKQIEYVDKLVKEAEKDLDKSPVYSSVDELFNALHIDIGEKDNDDTV